MAINAGTKNSKDRKAIAQDMRTIAFVSGQVGIGEGGVAGGMYNAARQANASEFTQLYNQTRRSARDLLEALGTSVDFGTFLDKRSKLTSVANQLKTAFDDGLFGVAPAAAAAEEAPLDCASIPHLERVYYPECMGGFSQLPPGGSVPGADPVLLDGSDFVTITDDSLTPLPEASTFPAWSDLSIEAQVGVGVAAAALVTGAAVLIFRR